MSPEALHAPSKAVPLTKSGGKKASPEMGKVFKSMRSKLAEVYPDKNTEAWSYESEDGGQHDIVPPTHNVQEWLDTRVLPSDGFSQRLVRRMVTHYRDAEKRGFKTNNKEEYDHQQALFSWMTLHGICSGVRDETCTALVRSPYGTGKSLLAGKVMSSAQDLALELLIEEEMERDDIPRTVFVGLKKEIAMQNTMGEQYSALRPPYNIDRSHMNEFYKMMVLEFGPKFEEFIPKPKGMKHPWYQMFQFEDEEEIDAPLRVSQFLQTFGKGGLQKFNRWSRSSEVFSMLTQLVGGHTIMLPDTQNKPRVREGQQLMADVIENPQYRGDSAYDLNPDIGIKTSHKHLMVNPYAYTTRPNLEEPALMGIVTGTAVSKAPDRIRKDIRAELMDQLALLVVDEAGKYTPNSLGHSAKQISGRFPNIIGFTGNGDGADGWTDRSPSMSIDRSIELRLTKSIAFQEIGTEAEAYPVGSEGALRTYLKHFTDEIQAAKKLKLAQPHMQDGFIIPPPSFQQTWETADRVQKLYDAEGIDAEVYAYDGKTGQDKWKIINDRLNAPHKADGVVIKVVGPASQLSTGISAPIGCIDVLGKVSEKEMDQLLGRLYHQRNMGGSNVERTFFRQLRTSNGSPLKLRSVAEEMGIFLPEDDASWIPLQCAIDSTAKSEDDKRRGMGKPVPLADTSKARKRELLKERKARKENDAGTRKEVLWGPVQPKSPYVLSELAKQAERKRRRDGKMGIAPEPSPELNGKKAKSVHAQCEILGEPVMVTFEVTQNGMPLQNHIEYMTREFGLQSNWSSIYRDVKDAYERGERGAKLAQAAGRAINRIKERNARMLASAHS